MEPQLIAAHPWEAVYLDDTRGGFYAVTNENWDGETCGVWNFREQANMAVVLLGNDGAFYDEGWSMQQLEDELNEAVHVEQCERCLKSFMAVQLSPGGECRGCIS